MFRCVPLAAFGQLHAEPGWRQSLGGEHLDRPFQDVVTFVEQGSAVDVQEKPDLVIQGVRGESVDGSLVKEFFKGHDRFRIDEPIE